MLPAVTDLQPPYTHHIAAAEGWIELGNLNEARAELAQIPESERQHPEFLSVHWSLCAADQNWAEALHVAAQLVEAVPDEHAGWLHQAYALRRAPGGGLQAAWDCLFPALKKFPKVPIIPYNLACYACQLDRKEQARELLKSAMSTGKSSDAAHIKLIALQDSDLEALWPEIREL